MCVDVKANQMIQVNSLTFKHHALASSCSLLNIDFNHSIVASFVFTAVRFWFILKHTLFVFALHFRFSCFESIIIQLSETHIRPQLKSNLLHFDFFFNEKYFFFFFFRNNKKTTRFMLFNQKLCYDQFFIPKVCDKKNMFPLA